MFAAGAKQTLLVLVTLAFLTPSGAVAVDGLDAVEEVAQAAPRPLPDGWLHDADGDRVDDRFASLLPGAPVAVSVQYDHPPTAADERALRDLGFRLDFTSKHVPVVFGALDPARAADAALLHGVLRVEMTETYTASNGVAAQATKARPSSTYANTVWDDLDERGRGVVIAVLDTAADDHQHECLSGKFLAGYDAINNAAGNPNDGNGHGTHVACTALGHGGTSAYPYGTNAGAAPEARLVDVQVLTSSGSSSGNSVAAGIEWAIDNRNTNWGVAGYEGIDVLSLSLGGSFDSDGTDSLSLLLNSAAEQGIIPVVAAGNSGDQTIASPGAADKAITVANMNDKNTVSRADDSIASSSSRGPRNSDGDGDTTDEQKPEVAAPGTNIRSAQHNTGSSYVDFSGTSMATPHTAGIIALMLEANPSLTWSDVEDIFRTTSDDYGSAGWDGTYGHGLVDAYDAVQEAAALLGGNRAPVADFSFSTAPFEVTVDGSASYDPDGDAITYAWDFGDGATASGATASHTYASTGTYTVTLTVSDGTDTDAHSASVTVTDGSDPDPSTSNLQNGQGQTVTVLASQDAHYKLWVPADATTLEVVLDGPTGIDLDLYTRLGARATDSAYDCRPYEGDSDERCSHADPAEGWWYVRVDSYSGGGTATLTATHDGGGQNAAPTADFTFSTNGLTADFDGSGSSDPNGDALTYAWDFGDGASGSGVAPSHTYAADGTYTVGLTVSDGNGGSDAHSASVTVASGGGGGTDPDPSTPNLDNGVGTSMTVAQGAWSYAKIQVPADATSFTVVMDGPACGIFGCSSDADLYVRLDAKPTASAYACRPYQSGSDESCDLGDAAAGWWYVGVHGYSGTTTVTVTATHDGSGGPTNNAPTASFTHATSDLTVSVDGLGSSDPDGDALSYAWDFGDGATAGGATASHAYASSGTYTVRLTVDDGRGGSDQSSQSVTVTAPNGAPSASFTSSCTGLSCDLDAGGSSDPDGDALTYTWDFGDGTGGSGALTTHAYASGGSYTITLTVSDGAATDTATDTVTVSDGGGACGADPDPGATTMESGTSYTASPAAGQWAYGKVCVPAGASVLDVVMDGDDCAITGCSYDSDLYVRQGARPTTADYDCRPYQTGNDETCNHPAPAAGWWFVGVHAYSGSGTVSLTATHDGGGGNGAPTASFTNNCTDLTCGFDASGSSDPDGDALTYAWDFGDGATGTGATPSHTYAAGTYTVTLTASDGQASDTATATVTATDPTGTAPAGVEFQWPMDGRVSSIYWECRSDCARYHRGVDIANGCDTPIYAARAGVADVRSDPAGYGNYVVVDHDLGFLTYYAHMDSVAVADGATVAAGDLLGYEGTTGSSTGCHVHFEIRQADGGPSYESDKMFIEVQESADYNQIQAGTPIAWDMKLYQVTTTANVRDGPGMTDVSGQGNVVLGTAAAGEKYVGLGGWTGPNGEYRAIKWNGQTGWIHASLLSEVSGDTARVTVDSLLNVRTGPASSYTDVGDVFGGQEYAILSEDASSGAVWYEIQYDHAGGDTGWVHSGYTERVTYGTPPANAAPTASFTTSTSGLDLSVDGTGSSDPDGDALTYAWDFGDGATGSGQAAGHTYASAGTYTVTLTASDGQASDTATASVTVTAPPTGGNGLAGYRIAVDPGHGGTDGGATYGGVEEADVNLAVALELQGLLEADGATVYMTRSTDTTVSLSDRSSGANAWGADYFLSIHANSCGSCGASGTETYYYEGLSAASTAAQLAGDIQPRMVAATGINDRGVKTANFHVLRETSMPAVLMEMAFVDHAGDRALLSDAGSQRDMALAMLNGLQEHLGVPVHDPEAGGTVYFSDDVEGASVGFTQTDSGGATSWSIVTSKAASGTRSLHAGDGSTYSSNSDDYLFSDVIDASGAGSLTLSFSQWLEGELYGSTIYDYGEVAVSSDGGSTWTTLETQMWDSGGVWETKSYDVSGYASSQFRVRWHWVSDGSVQNAGWFLDDVVVSS